MSIRFAKSWPIVGLILTLLALSSSIANSQEEFQPDFARQIRPILSNACFHCHGPDEQTREAGLRLDTKEGLMQLRDGISIVKSGNADESELIRRILSDDPDIRMPPTGSKKTLTDKQRSLLTRWVNSGAPWAQHWSFTPPVKPDVPLVPQSVNTVDAPVSAGNEIDRFLQQTQLQHGLTPSATADVMTLIRRVYLDLTGIQPTVEEADLWAAKLMPEVELHQDVKADSARLDEEAWQQLITELQSRQEYGERWARHWLDLARYADTNGYEKDRPRSIWPYRDWVINAINSDMPFDQFTIEQLAGDMLPDATESQFIATGFHRNTMLNEEGGIDPLEFRFHAMTDRVATTGTTWLGLTTGCAQCHTHKYDPLTHREYYQLMAFLNNADEPSMELADVSLQERWSANQKRADELQAELASQWPISTTHDVSYRIQSATATGSDENAIRINTDNWLTPELSETSSSVATYTIALAVSDFNFDRVSLQFRTASNRAGPGNSAGGNFVLSEISFQALFPSQHHNLGQKRSEKESELSPVSEEHMTKITLPIVSATSSTEQSGYELPKSFDGDPSTGWGLHGKEGIPKTAEAAFVLDTSEFMSFVKQLNMTGVAGWLRVSLSQQHGQAHTIGEFRIQPKARLSDADLEQQRTEQLNVAFEKWLSVERENAVFWRVMKPLEATSNLPILTIEADDAIFASGDTAKRDDYYVTLAALNEPVTALRLEALPDERLPARGPGSTYYEGTLGDFYLTEMDVSTNSGPFRFASATETYARNRFGNNPASAALAIDGDVQTGWSVHDRQGERHVAVFNLKEPIPAETPVSVHMSFGRHFASSLGRFRFSAAQASHPILARDYTDQVEQLLIQPVDMLSDDDRQTLFRQFLLSSPELASHVEQIRLLRKRPEVDSTLVLSERPASHSRPTFRHHRGEYLQPEEPIVAAPPEILHKWPADLPRNRLGFAKWLVLPDNPLTARVVVNRHCVKFFGRGIVATIDDFGLQGSPPDHPELLDWLATTFVVDDKWSVKKLHRRIVSSAAYRQSSAYRSDVVAIDPENRLLCFMPRLRLEAEIVRDSILQAATVLSHKRGGKPVHPLQPDGITEVAFGSPKWHVSAGEDRYRRSIYTMIKRTAPFAMITTFDGPGGEACVANRDRSNTPLQALALLNDVMFVDLANAAAASLMQREDLTTDRQLATQLFRQILVRHPDNDELSRMLQFVESRRAEFIQDEGSVIALINQTNAAKPDKGNSDKIKTDCERAVWTTLARALFSLDETVTRP